MKNIYVGNLSYDATEDDLRQAFEEHGQVSSVKVITDRETGRPRGFAFVTMEDNAAREAIEGLNGNDLDGRSINVNEAKPREGGGGNRGGGGGGYGGGRGGNRGGGGGGRRSESW